MKKQLANNNFLFFLAIVFSLWFAATGIFWVYWMALFVAYPFGIAAFFIWLKIKKDNKKRNDAIPIVLIIGLIASFVMLFGIVK